MPPEVGIELAAALALHERVHRAQALERVLPVEDPALVDLAQVALDVVAREGGAAEHHRDAVEAPLVQLLEVLAHDDRALHQQTAHADGVGLELGRLVDEFVSGTLIPRLCTS